MSFTSLALLVGLVSLTACAGFIVLWRRVKGTGDASEQSRLERFSWTSGIISMFAGVVSMMVAIATYIEEVGDDPGVGSVAPTPSGDPTLSGGEGQPSSDPRPPTGSQDGAEERQCRDDWAVMASGMAEYRACTTLLADGVALSAEIRPTELVTDSVEVTVWLWLMDVDVDLITNRQFDLTRDESTLDRCRRTLSGDEVQECGPFVVRPPHEGRFSTSGTAQLADDEYPPGWDNSDFAGTQGPAVQWPAETEEN